MLFNKITIASTVALAGLVVAVRFPINSDVGLEHSANLFDQPPDPSNRHNVTDTVTYTPPLSTSTSTEVVTVTASPSSKSSSKPHTSSRSVKSTSSTKMPTSTTSQQRLLRLPVVWQVLVRPIAQFSSITSAEAVTGRDVLLVFMGRLAHPKIVRYISTLNIRSGLLTSLAFYYQCVAAARSTWISRGREFLGVVRMVLLFIQFEPVQFFGERRLMQSSRLQWQGGAASFTL